MPRVRSISPYYVASSDDNQDPEEKINPGRISPIRNSPKRFNRTANLSVKFFDSEEETLAEDTRIWP
jgi:hypothetical protein